MQQAGECALCDQPIPFDPALIHVDHIVPKIQRGGDALDNLQVTHAACNLSKRDKDNEVARRVLLSRATRAHGVDSPSVTDPMNDHRAEVPAA